MDIDSFIKKHGPEWRQLETTCQGGTRGLAKLSGAQIDETVASYLRVSSHLATVRTKFRDRSLETYLNTIVTSAHGALYGVRPSTAVGLRRRFGSTYTTALRETAPFILLAVVVMIGVTLVTWWSVALSPDAIQGFVPESVRETLQRAGEGRAPDLGPPPGLSAVIFVNNVRVAFIAFALGITFGVGTMWVLVMNSAMLGTLAGVYTAAGQGAAFWALILPHGLLELLAICIAAGAGLEIGWSLIAPGDLTRSESLRRAAPHALLIVVGVIPAFGLAALIEGFITGTALPNVLELAIGVVAVVGYIAFCGAPAWRGRRRPPRPVAEPLPAPTVVPST